jgi:hypothetical protein
MPKIQKFPHRMNSTALESSCAKAGGVVSEGRNCICPLGTTSSFDAFTTGDFCSVSTEHDPFDSGTSVNNTAYGNSDLTSSDQAITMSGVIQLGVVISLSMLLVYLARKTFLRCLD